jgi:hypothetical protein
MLNDWTLSGILDSSGSPLLAFCIACNLQRP